MNTSITPLLSPLMHSQRESESDRREEEVGGGFENRPFQCIKTK